MGWLLDTRDQYADPEHTWARRALPWLRLADELGHPEGSQQLGFVLHRLGDTEGSLAAFRRAESRGNPSAPSTLGHWLRSGKDWDGAEAAYHRAALIGYEETCWADLATVLEQRGKLAAARDARLEALARDEPGALASLSWFYQEHPELKPPENSG